MLERNKMERGIYADEMGTRLLATMCEQITIEFPSIEQGRGVLSTRNYKAIKDNYWK